MIPESTVNQLSALLAVVLVRGLAVFAAAYAVTPLARSLSSETKHLICLGVIISFLLIPLAWMALPSVRLGSWVPVEPLSRYRLAAAPALSRAEYMRLIERAREQAILGWRPSACAVSRRLYRSHAPPGRLP